MMPTIILTQNAILNPVGIRRSSIVAADAAVLAHRFTCRITFLKLHPLLLLFLLLVVLLPQLDPFAMLITPTRMVSPPLLAASRIAAIVALLGIFAIIDFVVVHNKILQASGVVIVIVVRILAVAAVLGLFIDVLSTFAAFQSAALPASFDGISNISSVVASLAI
jgi:hypothetical protein